MKTIISIPLMLLILFSGISVKFATHYCGGHFAATKVSLTGELATCGMESSSDNNSFGNSFNKHCCDDITSAYSISDNYIPSSYDVKEPWQHVLNLIVVPAGFPVNQEKIVYTSCNSIRPPGINYPNSVARPAICVFRI